MIQSYEIWAILWFVCMTVILCVCVRKQRCQGGWGECMLSSESKSTEKERAESGPVICFQNDTRTQAGRQRG